MAQQLFKEGNELFARGMLLDALKAYRKSQKLHPSYKVDLNIGGTLDELGRRAEAAWSFHRFMVHSASAPADVVQQARARLAQLKHKLASVKVSCGVDGAVVAMDGKEVGLTPLELPIYLEPGKHVLSVTKRGKLAFTRKLALLAGQHRVLTTATRSATRLRAEALFKEGNELFAQGLYLDALRLYRKSRQLRSSYRVDLNISGALDQLGRRTQAASLTALASSRKRRTVDISPTCSGCSTFTTSRLFIPGCTAR